MRSVHITRTLVISVIIVVICASYFIWYHFDMYSDVDKDGIIKKLEIKYGTDPHKPNFVLRYLITLDRVAYYDKLKSLDRGKFNDIKKELFQLFTLFFFKFSQFFVKSIGEGLNLFSPIPGRFSLLNPGDS